MATVVFWGSALLLLHTYLLYPLLLLAADAWAAALANLRGGRPHRSEPRVGSGPSAGSWPTVTVVCAAYNEAVCIAQKIDNTLALDYPAGRLDLLVGSDGSTDGTDEKILSRADRRVRLSRGERGGKTSVLNRCIPTATGDIVVLTDANTQIDPGAVAKLVRHFEDPEVGAVCGKLRLFNPTKRDYEESAYWSYESLLKLYEGKRGAVMGANGGLYAIRRVLFEALPPDTIVDDFVIPLRILERGYKVTYEPEAVAHEETTEDYAKEFGRRARIAAGNFQSLKLLASLLSPAAGFACFAFWSHKVLRWCAPALMLTALVSNAFLLADSRLYLLTFALQAGFYVLAGAGSASLFSGALRRAASVAFYFVHMNVAIAVGFWRFLRNSQAAAWDRTARAS